MTTPLLLLLPLKLRPAESLSSSLARSLARPRHNTRRWRPTMEPSYCLCLAHKTDASAAAAAAAAAQIDSSI